MRRAVAFTLLLLAEIVVAFVATWVTIPTGRYGDQKNLTTGDGIKGHVEYPARLFRVGLVERDKRCKSANAGQCTGGDALVVEFVDLHALRERVVVFYAGLACAVALIGLALGLMVRPSTAARE